MFFPLQGKEPKEIHTILTEILGEHPSLCATVRNWVVHVKRSDIPTCDVPGPGQPKTLITQEIINQIHVIIMEVRRISA